MRSAGGASSIASSYSAPVGRRAPRMTTANAIKTVTIAITKTTAPCTIIDACRRARMTVSLERREELRERLHLIAPRRRRDEDQRAHTGGTPALDAVADRRRRPEERRVGEPAVGERVRDRVVVAALQRRFDGFHLLDVARGFPVRAIIRQRHVAGQRAAVHRRGL